MEQGIKFVITGDTKGLEQAADKAKKEVDGLGSEIEQAQKKIQGYRQEMRSLRDEFTKGNISQKQYGQSFVGIEKNLRKAENELEDLEKGLRDTAKQTDNLVDANKKLDAPTKKTTGALEGLSGTLKNMPTSIDGVVDSLDNLVSIVGAGAVLQIGVAALAAVWALWGDEIKESISNTDEFADATRNAVAEIQGERATMNALLSVARDENTERQKRVDAIRILNDQYPELNNQIKLETINTQATTKAIDEATKAIETRAKIRAAENLISQEAEKLFTKQVKLEQDREDAIASSVNAQLQSQRRYSAGVSSATLDYQKVREQVEERVNKEFAGRLESSEKDYQEYIKRLNKIISESDNLLDVFGITDGGDVKRELEKALDLDDIFEIDQKKITGKFVDPIKEELNRLGILLDQAPDLVAPRLSNLETEFRDSAEKINETLRSIGAEEVDFSGLGAEKTKELIDNFSRLETVAAGVQEGLSSAFSSLASGITGNIEEAEGGLARFGAALAANTVQVLGAALSQSIANAILGSTQGAVGTGPLAPFTQPAFLASMVGGVIAAFAAIPKFAQGGVAGGGSFTGDQILARLNSGERVLTIQDQGLLTRFLRGETMGTTNQTGGLPNLEAATVLRGSDIYLSWRRTERSNNRFYGGK